MISRYDLLFRPAGDDPCRTLGADTGHLAQALRLLLDEIEHRLSETPYQPLGVDRADAADHARGEVPFDPLQDCRRADLEEGCAELLAVGAVVHPGATHLDKFAGADHRRVADHSDLVFPPSSSYQRYNEPADIGSQRRTTLRQTSELIRGQGTDQSAAEKTVSNGCNEAESMAAAEMVGRLLERYVLSMDEIDVREPTLRPGRGHQSAASSGAR